MESPWIFLLPFGLVFVALKLAPILASFLVSLYRLDITGRGPFIGLSAYARLPADPLFVTALRNTFYYLLLLGPVVVVGGFLVALLLNQRLYGRSFARTVVFLPYVIMVVVVGAIWRWILDSNFGLLNAYLRRLGLGPVYWLSSSATSMIGIVIATTWWTIGYNMVIFLAGLQDVPRELIEAAEMDGAGAVRRLFRVVIPVLRPTFFFVVLTTVIYSLQVFGQIYTMTAGGPQYSTLTLVQYLYIVGFRQFQLGYSATISMALFAMIALLSAGMFRLFREEAQ